MSYASINALRESLAQSIHRTKDRSSDYVARMIHDVPDAEVVDRVKFILSRCEGKRVLDVGASGKMADLIDSTAIEYWGIDHPYNDKGKERPGIFFLDLDDSRIPLPNRDVDVIVCGEVIEHLSNPGQFLDRLRALYPIVPVVATVPNAFSEVARRHMETGTENVNIDHVCWYSWRTFTTLVNRAGYVVKEFYWYNGRPGLAEGLIFVLE